MRDPRSIPAFPHDDQEVVKTFKEEFAGAFIAAAYIQVGGKLYYSPISKIDEFGRRTYV